MIQNALKREFLTVSPSRLQSSTERFRRRELTMCDSSLSAKARVLFAILDEFARDKGACHPSQETLVSRSGFPARTVQRYISELRNKGIIETAHQGYHSPLEYRLNRVAKITQTGSPDPPPVATLDPPPVATLGGLVLITETKKKETREIVDLTVGQFRELEDGFDRHLKHHRTEDRDNVLRLLMDQAQRGVFDWDRYRLRHAVWCASQERSGWQYATLTFLAWIRAGMPPAPPGGASGKQEGATERAKRYGRERLLRDGIL